MPPSPILAANSADTNAIGIRNVTAEKIKKNISVVPNKAVAGKLRMPSIAPVIKSVKATVFSLFNFVIIAKPIPYLITDGYVQSVKLHLI